MEYWKMLLATRSNMAQAGVTANFRRTMFRPDQSRDSGRGYSSRRRKFSAGGTDYSRGNCKEYRSEVALEWLVAFCGFKQDGDDVFDT